MLWLLCCLPVVTGCIREEEYANDPVGNFEQLWKIIDERYCFLEEKGIDLESAVLCLRNHYVQTGERIYKIESRRRLLKKTL